MPRSHRHLAAVLCVLLLNLQLFAANALGCLHDEAGSVGLNCPHAGAVAAADTASQAQDAAPVDRGADEPCQKCNLGTVVAGWHLFDIHAPALALQYPRQVPPVAVAARLTSHSPDGLLRPPRGISV